LPERPRSQRALAGAGALLLTLVLAGCFGDGREQVEVLDAMTWPGADVISLSVDSCNASPSVKVVEQAGEVVVEVEADDPGLNRDDCADNVLICLDEPLGDRVLVDDVSGDVVSVDVGASDAPQPGCPIS
jgi:hypothetical protein